MIESRHIDLTPIRCDDCGWKGRVMDCTHGYAHAWPSNAEPMDFCPKCDSKNLIPIGEDMAPV